MIKIMKTALGVHNFGGGGTKPENSGKEEVIY